MSKVFFAVLIVDQLQLICHAGCLLVNQKHPNKELNVLFC